MIDIISGYDVGIKYWFISGKLHRLPLITCKIGRKIGTWSEENITTLLDQGDGEGAGLGVATCSASLISVYLYI